jgi:hypothetical protein
MYYISGRREYIFAPALIPSSTTDVWGPLFGSSSTSGQICGRREGRSPNRPRQAVVVVPPGQGRASIPVLCSAGPMELTLRGFAGPMALTRSVADGPMLQQPEEAPTACWLTATLLPALARRRRELGHGRRRARPRAS